ncbi:cobalamin biosynthesis protein [Haloplanus ruber]|uniref:Cobalamin biosynthesis protein n=1 Tax=Haloplanus ruber TaxID=869892 RepID=A0ABD6D077_9EURY|nr:cobalamin biosynthesis protein [Haloplanus ruber]
MTADSPSSLLECHPETAYFWGHVAGDGEVRADDLTVRAPDEGCADRLVAIAGGGDVDHHRTEREYAHDTSITRTEDEYHVTVAGDVAARGSAAFGLPTGENRGGYRFDALADANRQLLRGLLESCGTVCFKSSAGVVGISFVHDDRTLLETIQGRLDACPVDVPTDDIAETSSGGYWFGVDDAAGDRFGRWVYDGSEATDLFAPTRRQKLLRSLEQAEG